MEAVVSIISKETIKLSSSKPYNIHEDPKLFKISLLDQVTPATYFPYIFFYPSKPAESFTTRLKNSLSETLTRFYPFSGRLVNNLFAVDFHRHGVPFLQARVSFKMSTFLSEPKLSLLNHLLPCLPFRNPNTTPLSTHQVAVQVNEFSCGGVAVGVCASHKIADATSFVSFLSSWAAATRQDQDHDNENGDLNDVASLRFPAVDPLPEFYTSMYDSVWFSKGTYRTERFVFDAKALAALKESATSDLQRVHDESPSRVQALSGFIWKSAMAASRAVLASPPLSTSLMCQAVNLRRGAHEARVGNMFWWAIAVHNDHSATVEEKELPSLVEQLCESIAEMKDYYKKSMRGEEAFDAIGDHFRLLEELYTVEQPEIYGCTSWVNMGLNEVDFGLGRPVWVGTFGEVGPEFRNLIVLKDETTRGKGIEAWVTLDDKVLASLTTDPNFLAFASVNPPIPSVEKSDYA